MPRVGSFLQIGSHQFSRALALSQTTFAVDIFLSVIFLSITSLTAGGTAVYFDGFQM